MSATSALLLLSMLIAGSPAQGPADDPPAAAKQADDPLGEARGATDHEDWEKAVALFRAFLDAHPTSPEATEARFWVGFCEAKRGENEKAVEILHPFTQSLADNKWADDAIFQIGKAYRELGKETEAIDSWKRHLEKYPKSVWRAEVLIGMIEIHFYDKPDLSACVNYCRQLTDEVPNKESTTEARYLGAYCLNALGKPSEAEAWADRLFDPESATEEAWRRLLSAHRDLLRGDAEPASAIVEAIDTEFPDLDQNDRLDFLVKTAYILRHNARADRARELLGNELSNAKGLSEDQLGRLFEDLQDAHGDEHPNDYIAALGRIATDLKTPVVVRVSARDRQADALREKLPQLAAAMLRDALRTETAEFPRCRAALKLAEILAGEMEKPGEAVALIDEILENLKRRDLVQELREAVTGYREQSKEKQAEAKEEK